MKPARLLAIALALVALARPAPAHELGLVQVEGTFRKDGSYVVDLLVDLEHLPPATSGRVTPEALLDELASKAALSFDGRRPARSGVEVTPHLNGKANVTRLRLSGRTPPNVSRFTFSDPAISGFFVLRLANEGQERATTRWVEGGKTSAPFALDAAVVPPSRWSIVKLYAGLGFTHILPRGIDHVLFVLGIFLLAVEIKPVLTQVTAFTVAHTITLALTMYGVVSLPARIVEPLIAISIVCVAVENVFTSRLHVWRPVLVFAFGLLHGMGFAGVLTEIGLPRSEFVPALLAFNAGVEAGQLTVIAAAFLLFGLPFRRERWYRRRIVVPASLAIAAIALYWSVERVLAGS
jgi:hydrogenase/urease accessory protein HupE